jgi:hypothetical protein
LNSEDGYEIVNPSNNKSGGVILFLEKGDCNLAKNQHLTTLI